MVTELGRPYNIGSCTFIKQRHPKHTPVIAKHAVLWQSRDEAWIRALAFDLGEVTTLGLPQTWRGFTLG